MDNYFAKLGYIDKVPSEVLVAVIETALEGGYEYVAENYHGRYNLAGVTVNASSMNSTVNITDNMTHTTMAMVLLNDRELPLTAIHGFQKTYCTATALDEYVDSTLFTFKGNDTDAMAERKVKLMLALTYFTFLLYPHASLKWFEEGRGILAFPYNILADALIMANYAMKLNGYKSMAELTENINDYTDEYIDTIIKLPEANTVADDDLMTRFNRVQEYLHSFHDAVWETVKEVEIIKNRE